MSPVIATSQAAAQKTPLSRFELVAYAVYAAVFVVLVIDLSLADTKLISPIEWHFRMFARTAGTIAGAGLGVLLLRRMLRMPGKRIGKLFLVLLISVMTSFFYFAIFDYAATRISDLYSFHGSAAPVSRVLFPIVSYSSGRGRNASIGFRGESWGGFDITQGDLAVLQAAGRAPGRYCMALMYQEEGQAARVYLRSVPSAGHRRKMVTIEPCPASAVSSRAVNTDP